MKLLLRTVTVLFVLCLAGAGVALYRMNVPERPAPVAGDATPGIALGKFTPLDPPRPAPGVNFTDQSGKTVTFADFAGRPVLVNLWATWCAPCIKEMPSLAALQARMKDLQILAISEDRGGANAVGPFLAKNAIAGLAIYLDPKSDVGHAFNVEGLPTSLLIDAKGQVRGELQGAATWESDAMVALLKGYMEDSGAPAR